MKFNTITLSRTETTKNVYFSVINDLKPRTDMFAVKSVKFAVMIFET